MSLPRSSFYYQPRVSDFGHVQMEIALLDRIEAICLEFPRYGYRRVTKQLQREGWLVNYKRVLRLMRQSDLLCQVKRKWVRTTDSNDRFRIYPNLIKRACSSAV